MTLTSRAPSGTAAPRRTNSDMFLLWLIIVLAPIGQMAIDIYVPSLPVMTDYFESSSSAVQLSVSLYLVAFALGQLVYGPISDSFGRKRSLLIGISLYLVGALGTLVAPSIGWFIAARIVQGFGITAASVVMKAIATDRFSPPRLGQVMTYMVISWGLGPIIAPVIGASLQLAFDWRYSLYFLIGYGVLLLTMVGIVYQETLVSPQPLRFRTLAATSAVILRDGVFTRIYLSMGLCYAVLLTFNLLGPFLVQDTMNYPPSLYAGLALLMGLAYLLGVLSNRVLPPTISMRRKFVVASNAAMAASLAMLIASFATQPNLWVLSVPTAVIVFFAGMMYPNLMAAGVSRFAETAGLASSLLGFCLMLISGVIMLLSGALSVDSVTPLAAVFAGCTVLCRLLVLKTVPE